MCTIVYNDISGNKEVFLASVRVLRASNCSTSKMKKESTSKIRQKVSVCLGSCELLLIFLHEHKQFVANTLKFVQISCNTPPETPSRGPLPHSRNDPGMWLVFSDSTRRAAHAYIRETSQRVAEFFMALWSWKFWPKNDTFFGYNVYFLATGWWESNL